jgi:beta-lactamase class A
MLNHAPVTEAAVGSTLSIERLCRAAVEVSDNPAANILMREIGGLEAMRIWYRSIGDQDTRVDRWEMELNVPDGDMDTIRPHQAVRNLQAVLLAEDDTVLDQANRDRLTEWLVASPSGPGRIKAGTPAGWTVAHKTGTASGGVNDIGVLWTPDYEPFVAAAYFDGEAGAPVERGEAAIAEAVRRAIEVFS